MPRVMSLEMYPPIRKFMVLICMLCFGDTDAQQVLPSKDGWQKAQYPYLGKSGKFGYVDEMLTIVIEPQYNTASVFSAHGFAVITDSMDRKGVIDRNNRIILPADYEYIRLFRLEDYTLAEVYSSYISRWRFWEWKFLPGFSITGGSSDNRLFDTAVKRMKKTVFVLGDQLHRVRHERITDQSYVDKYFSIRALDSNQVLIDDRLYSIGPKGARRISSGIKEPVNPHTFAQQKGRRLWIIDRKGKRIDNKSYQVLDSIPFMVADTEAVTVPLDRSSYGSIASAYQDEDGQTFIYPDFSKPLPLVIGENRHPDDPIAEELIHGLWLVASVPDSDYFLFISFCNGERFFRFLDKRGTWHQSLPGHISYAVVRPSGDIIWSTRKQAMPPHQALEGWKVDRRSAVREGSLYHITLSKAQEVRQGIWDANEEQWCVDPQYYSVYTMGNQEHWRYQAENNGLWGILDADGKVLIKPTYHSIHPDGLVTVKENDAYTSFYLHPKTLKELREK